MNINAEMMRDSFEDEEMAQSITTIYKILRARRERTTRDIKNNREVAWDTDKLDRALEALMELNDESDVYAPLGEDD
jgi:hypothetical protein